MLFLSSQSAKSFNKRFKFMFTYLALGDSYTIGEQVPLGENFPYQTVRLLREANLVVSDPLIIATTGWTTDELAKAISEHDKWDAFSFVTLLIGVNNQYRGREIEDYKREFTSLLEQAIGFANGHCNNVFVLSIPDWGVTPFAEGRDRTKIHLEIDQFNAANKKISQSYNCHYLDITDSTREHGQNRDYLAGDGLHPSGKEYAVWAHRLVPMIEKVLRS
jgi:lysophospholipase L1-like esterase